MDIEDLPYARFLGLRLDVTEDDHLTVTMPFAEPLIGNPMIPALHGGATAAMLELTAMAQVAHDHPSATLPRPINVTVAYHRPGRARDVLARAQILKTGRRVVYVQAEAWQEKEQLPIATLSAHFLLAE